MIQTMLADCRAECNAARAMILDAARKRDGGGDVTMDAACAKLFASEMVGRVADRAVQIFGGSGYVADYGIERFYRDVRIFRLYEGTSEIQRLIIAREMMKRGS
jgi:acyl-CoA dehydrogenase